MNAVTPMSWPVGRWGESSFRPQKPAQAAYRSETERFRRYVTGNTGKDFAKIRNANRVDRCAVLHEEGSLVLKRVPSLGSGRLLLARTDWGHEDKLHGSWLWRDMVPVGATLKLRH